MLQVTDRGIIIDRLSDIHQRLTDRFKTIYGQNINVSPDTPDGQMIGIFSQSLADINEVIAFICQMLDPYQATGLWLEQRALYAGIVRRGAEYSYLDGVAIIGSALAHIPKNTVLIDSNKGSWLTMSDVTLDSNGSAKANLRSKVLGAFAVAENEELKLETVFVGVKKITVITPAKVGKEEESDAQLLRRFMMAHSLNNNDDRVGIQAALLSLPDVKKALVLENYTSQLDVETGVPAHSMNAIVVGGSDEEVAQTLLRKKIGGCAFFGMQQTYADYKDRRRQVKFDRAVIVPVKVSLVLQRLRGFTDLNETDIKEALTRQDFDIGETVYAMGLVCAVNKQEGFTVKSITVNGSSSVPAGYRAYAEIDEVEIIIE